MRAAHPMSGTAPSDVAEDSALPASHGPVKMLRQAGRFTGREQAGSAGVGGRRPGRERAREPWAALIAAPPGSSPVRTARLTLTLPQQSHS